VLLLLLLLVDLLLLKDYLLLEILLVLPEAKASAKTTRVLRLLDFCMECFELVVLHCSPTKI
jgi:hypothetical protein